MSPTAVARLAAFAVALLGAVLLIGAGWTPNVQPDADAYWHAALRLREGMPLYLPAGADETEIYRYAPWFAFAWLPLTYLSQDAAYLVWRGLLLVAAIAAVAPLLRRPSPAAFTLSVLLFSLLVSNLPAANVTTLMVGVLAIGLPTRAGPYLLGAAASLKVFPILLVAGYVAERRWREAVISIAIAAVLWAHVLVFGLDTYPTTTVSGESFYLGGVSLLALHPALLVTGVVVFAAAGMWLVVRGSRWTWLLAGAAIPTVVPRVWLPDAAWVSPATSMLLRSEAGSASQDSSADRAPGSDPDTPRTSPPTAQGPE
ncbi:MAG TPA: hypothetical protein VHU77_07715 [Candidatus Limnocylindria bacterium]|jgi:hypothetical protein|nr:hypothetical protein [Candidatus Limnocylindria bacterium]